jgi:choline-sulfatase
MRQVAVAMFLCGVIGPGAVVRGDAPPPNVVFLYTDDQARWAMGAYGNAEIKTPRLDRLAREGALFRNAFAVTPVCSPSRAAMMTGRYPTRLGIDDWIDPAREPDLGLAPSETLWPELLKGSGYATMLCGKWHLGTRDAFHPTRQGYDRFFGFRAGGNVPIDPTLEVEGTVRKLSGSLPDLLVDQGIRFVEANRTRPFLLSVHFRAPHAPYAPVPEADSAVFRDLDPTIPIVPGLPLARVKKLTREYYASVHSVDRNVGRLLDALERLGLAGNTIVVFTSDHGYMIGHHGLWHKGNASWILEGRSGPRPNLFDDAIRVPFVVRWPGQVRSGTVVDNVVSNIDILPSLMEMVGVGVPDNLAIDGKSFVAALRGASAGAKIATDDTLFGQYDMHHGAVARMRMIRTREWKLIRHFEPGVADELYDLSGDPGETRNLVDSPAHRERRSELARRLAEFMTRVGDPLAVTVARERRGH